MMPGDERYYERGLQKLQAENDQLRTLLDRVTNDLEAHEAGGNETPTLAASELRAVLGPVIPAAPADG